MTRKQMIGLAMIWVPLIGAFGCLAYSTGFGDFFLGVGIAVAYIAYVRLAFHLIDDGEK